MLERYEDIKKRIKDPILWYDENGVPRYDKFNKSVCPDIYADEVVLLEIACQDCNKKFLVEMSWSHCTKIFERHTESISARLYQWIESNKKGWPPLHYGDPPRHDYCVGETMNCVDIRVIEFWQQEKFGWKRLPQFEIELVEGEKCV